MAEGTAGTLALVRTTYDVLRAYTLTYTQQRVAAVAIQYDVVVYDVVVRRRTVILSQVRLRLYKIDIYQN